MVMYKHTRCILYQSQKLSRLEEAYKVTNASSYNFSPKLFSETVKSILDTTFQYRRGEDHEKAVGEVLRILNNLVNNQRLEAKEDLYTLLKEEEAEDIDND